MVGHSDTQLSCFFGIMCSIFAQNQNHL